METKLANEDEQFTFDFNKETAEITTGSNDDLEIKLGEFAGPLDLLLFLIRQERADIFDIPIARITEQFQGLLPGGLHSRPSPLVG